MAEEVALPQTELPLAESVPNAQNTEAPAPSATPDAKPEAKPVPTPEEAEKKRGQSRFDRKLDRAYRERAEANARANLLESQLAELRQPKPSPQDGEPRLDQHDFDPEKYATAKAEYAKAQAGKDFETRQRTQTQRQAQQRLVSVWEEKAERGAEKYDDWEAKVGVLQPTVPFIAALMDADNGDDIAHHLASNPKEARRIVMLPPYLQYREIGKLEVKLLSVPEKTKVPSKAPAPINPLAGTTPAVSGSPLATDDDATWIAKRSKQVHGKR